MGAAAAAVGIPIATGDTKVVERGKADGVYVTTTGVGVLDERARLGPECVEPGDRVLVSGTIGDHGTAVMVSRGELELEVDLESDTAPVYELVSLLLELGDAVRWMRDPTRGGLATALNELAQQAGVAVVLNEGALPLRPAVVGTCEILGLDPLYVACEGRVIAVVASGRADAALERLRSHPLGTDAAIIGEIRPEPPAIVLLDTAFGGTRIVDMLVGDPLPRIC
jgi:hydrogenase expression/formation protein HypE